MAEFNIVNAWWQRNWLKCRAFWLNGSLHKDPDQRVTEIFFKHLLDTHAFLTRVRVKKNQQPVLKLPLTLVIGPTATGKSNLLLAAYRSWLKAPELEIDNAHKIATVLPKLWVSHEGVTCEIPAYYFRSNANQAGFYFERFVYFYKEFGYFKKVKQIIHVLSFEHLLALAANGETDYFAQINFIAKQLPSVVNVFITITQIDRIQGFTEFFADLSFEERQLACGMSIHSKDSVSLTMHQFDLFMQRLNERLAWRCHGEPLLQRRLLVAEFPRQFAELKKPLLKIVQAWQRIKESIPNVHLRGAYFLSTMQQGKLIDLLQNQTTGFCRSASKTTLPMLLRHRTFFVRGWFQHICSQQQSSDLSRSRKKAPRTKFLGGIFIALLAVASIGAYLFLEWQEPEMTLRSRPDLAFALATSIDPRQATEAYLSYTNPNMPTVVRNHLIDTPRFKLMLKSEAAYYLNDQWQKQIAKPYQSLVGKYPLDPHSKQDMNWQTFNDFFGPQGRVNKFKQDYIKPAMLADLPINSDARLFYQRLEKLQAELYNRSGQLSISFTIYPDKLEKEKLDEVSLELAGQAVKFKPHVIASQVFVWPDNHAKDESNLRVLEKSKVAVEYSFQGSWSWLRLLKEFGWQQVSASSQMNSYYLTPKNSLFRLTLTCDKNLPVIFHDLSLLQLPGKIN